MEVDFEYEDAYLPASFFLQVQLALLLSADPLCVMIRSIAMNFLI